MKAILVVDIGNDEYLLNKKIDTICFKDGDKIYDNFNFLKPIPKINEKRINFLRECGWGIWEIERYAVGHGDCIDEILGEIE